MKSIYIYFVGGDSLNLHSNHIHESDLNSLLNWFKANNDIEVKAVRYNMNGTIGEYILNRNNIAYMKTVED